MPNRPLARAAARSERQAFFDSLPDALLCDILLLVPFEERRGLTRVCRRWRQLVDSPPLLRRVSVSLAAIDPREAAPPSDGSGSEDGGDYWYNWQSEDPERPIQHILDSFTWLQRQAAPHVEQLSISLGQLVIDYEHENEWHAASELCKALHACTRLQGLTLSLECSLQLDIEEHLAPSAQAQLRSLEVTCMNWNEPDPNVGVTLSSQAFLNVGGLATLTALETLHLVGQALWLTCPADGGIFIQLPHVQPKEADSLPPSLTSLTLEGYAGWHNEDGMQFVPPQITALTNLRRLALGSVPCNSGADLRSLTTLSSLTSLHLSRCAHLPVCLPQLLQLRALRLNDSPRGVPGGQPPAQAQAQAELASTVQHLAAAAADRQQLTHLVLQSVLQLPAEVAALAHLQTLFWVGGQADTQLPAIGPYLTSLRRLALSSRVAASNTAVLSAMPNLQALAVLGPAGHRPKDVATELSIVQWAAQQQQPSLRRLAVSFNKDSDFRQGSWAWSQYGKALLAELAQLHMPPWLQVELSNVLLRDLQNT